MFLRAFIIHALLAAILAMPAAGATTEKNLVPTRVTAERLTYSQDGNRAVFEGNVHVTRQDIELWADRIEIEFLPSASDRPPAEKEGMAFATGEGAAQIRRIEATGNVRMRRGQSTGRCQKATYLAQENMIVLEGNPILQEGKNMLQGKEIRIYIGENRSEVIGTPRRPVEMIFVTPEKDPEKRQ